MVNFEGEVSKATPLSPDERSRVFKELCTLRAAEWSGTWCRLWPGFGPRALVADADLEAVARIAPSIKSVEDLRPLVRVAYWRELAPWLLGAIHDTVIKLDIHDPDADDEQPSDAVSTSTITLPVAISSAPVDATGTQAQSSRSKGIKRVRALVEPGLKSMHPAEMLIRDIVVKTSL